MPDYYDDTEGEAKPKPKTKADEGAATALLPLTFFPEKPEPGKVCSIRVEKVYNDQASVSYSKKEEPAETEDEMETESPSEMDAMMA